MTIDEALRPHETFQRWMRRVHFPQQAWLPLGGPGELWREQHDHPASAWVTKKGAALGRTVDTTYYTTRTLVDDLVYAAGGVEYAAHRVLEQLDVEQQRFDEYRQAHAEEDEQNKHVPITWGFATPAVMWDYENLLTALRSVGDRIQRREPKGAMLGLLPAIADDTLRGEIEVYLHRYRERIGGDRQLANYALHASRLPSGGSAGAEVTANGALMMRIPDPIRMTVYVFDQFTYDEDRDLRTFAQLARAAVEELMEEFLGSLERANARIKAARDVAAAT